MDPNHIVVAGDWHGNTRWAEGVIDLLPDLLPDESPRRIVHTGDFGVWPGDDSYIDAVDRALSRVDGELWFVDGNHEDHNRLRDLAAHTLPSNFTSTRIPVHDRVSWLPRGYRWTWHDRTWLALGGATSVDRLARTINRDWWESESIGEADYRRATEPGAADVMVTHDCPAGVRLDLPQPPAWWDMEPAYRHRLLLGAIVSRVQPSWLMHGHYHLAHDTTVATSYGELHVAGLDMDGALRGNYRMLDVRDMSWGSVS